MEKTSLVERLRNCNTHLTFEAAEEIVRLHQELESSVKWAHVTVKEKEEPADALQPQT